MSNNDDTYLRDGIAYYNRRINTILFVSVGDSERRIHCKTFEEFLEDDDYYHEKVIAAKEEELEKEEQTDDYW